MTWSDFFLDELAFHLRRQQLKIECIFDDGIFSIHYFFDKGKKVVEGKNLVDDLCRLALAFSTKSVSAALKRSGANDST